MTSDWRSDTLTLPSQEMLSAITVASLGDDQYGEDATTQRLESLAAEMLGKEAALLVLSGTMGNLLSILSHTEPGQELILGVDSHIYNAEVGGLARIGGIIARPLMSDAYGLRPEDVEQAIRSAGSSHRAPTGLIAIENTSNRGGGSIVPLIRLDGLAEVARRHSVPIHMDGARLFNAAVGLGIHVSEIARHVDSVQICMTKGLSAPLGSLLAGNQQFVDQARRYRQMVGGGMRQAGIIAAAGIVALETMVDRLAEDHHNASALAKGLTKIKGLAVDSSVVDTNIVYVGVSDLGITGEYAVRELEKRGVKTLATGPAVLRFVAYKGIGSRDVEHTVNVLGDFCQAQLRDTNRD
jgi:threonine aldolase|tara:strand:- start:9541 stop:10599 length:1059 start_codon:yes stop_codon:yes gene_type:complete